SPVLGLCRNVSDLSRVATPRHRLPAIGTRSSRSAYTASMQQRWPSRAAEALAVRPLVPVAVKVALAAALAWLVVQPLGGAADHYTYYAPLGAVVVVSSRLGQSLRWSV